MSNRPGIKNNVCVQVYNKDGSLDQQVEGHNFISINNNWFGEVMLRQMLCNNKNYNRTYNINAFADFIDGEFITEMVCTDSSLAESPSTEVDIPGTEIAYCTLAAAFAQTTGTRGSISEGQSKTDNKKALFVGEWIEDTGNGTFQSVCLGNRSFLARPNLLAYDHTENFYSFCYDGTYIWARDNSNVQDLYKVNATTYAIEETRTLSGLGVGSAIVDLTYYNGNLYITTSSTGVWEYNVTTEALVKIITPTQYDGITNDGTYLYLSQSTGLIVRADFTGAYISDFTVDVNAYFLAYDGTDIYIVHTDFRSISKVLPGGTTTTFLAEYQSQTFGIEYVGTQVLTSVTYATRRASSSSTATAFGIVETAGNATMFNRVLLPSIVTKDNTQTMKVTVTINFT